MVTDQQVMSKGNQSVKGAKGPKDPHSKNFTVQIMKGLLIQNLNLQNMKGNYDINTL